LDDLAELKMGVRVDSEGIPAKDYHTTQDVITADGKKRASSISNRWYLSDAVFLAALQGPKDILETLHTALSNPKWPLFLGRKSFVPAIPPFLNDGLRQGQDMRQTFASYPLLITKKRLERRLREVERGRETGRVRLVLESDEPTHESRKDLPVSFDWENREFRERFVKTEYIDLKSLKENGGWKCI
jgi:CRISPR system Cascade subunit CasD